MKRAQCRNCIRQLTNYPKVKGRKDNHVLRNRLMDPKTKSWTRKIETEE